MSERSTHYLNIIYSWLREMYYCCYVVRLNKWIMIFDPATRNLSHTGQRLKRNAAEATWLRCAPVSFCHFRWSQFRLVHFYSTCLVSNYWLNSRDWFIKPSKRNWTVWWHKRLSLKWAENNLAAFLNQSDRLKSGRVITNSPITRQKIHYSVMHRPFPLFI